MVTFVDLGKRNNFYCNFFLILGVNLMTNFTPGYTFFFLPDAAVLYCSTTVLFLV